MRTKNYLCVILLLWGMLVGYRGEAKVKLPVLISDGMVLQRDTEGKIWGWADPGEEIQVTFMRKKYHTQADESGNWAIKLPAIKAGGPYTMTVNEVEIKNILIGEVWICSGQSNMELPVRRVMDRFAEEVNRDVNPQIRHVKVPLAYDFHQPQVDLPATAWKELTPENALDFSAVAYFFAKDYYNKTHIPVGIINSSVGGSPAEAWISEENLKEFPRYLNELEMCRDDQYVAEVKRMDWRNQQAWNTALSKADAGLQGSVKWFADQLDDSGWTKTTLFDPRWQTVDGIPANGSIWFRKHFQMTAAHAGKEAVLRLGCIVDADSVFVNGHFVGSVGYQYPPRIYAIPQGVLRKGDNHVTVRLISYAGKPAFVADKPYKILIGQEEISLEGEWKYRVGTLMPGMPGTTFFHYKPVGLYNAMIAPLVNYRVAGVLWYQGESNTGKAGEYEQLLATLIRDWRAGWQREELPFLIVQLANFMQSRSYPVESGWAMVREAQRQVAQKLPAVALATAIDLGEWNDIHPLEKKELGRRLSLQAQRLVDGNDRQAYSGPMYVSRQIKGNKVRISFEPGTDDLQPVDELKGFAIAGTDGHFKWAKARIEGKQVIVWNEEIAHPVVVRYAWEDNPAGANLKNKAGLPCFPFQTEY